MKVLNFLAMIAFYIIAFFRSWFNWYKDCLLILVGKLTISGAYNTLPKSLRILTGFMTFFITGQGIYNIFQVVLGTKNSYYHFLDGVVYLVFYYCFYRLSIVRDNSIANTNYYQTNMLLARELASECMDISTQIINDIHKNPLLSNDEDVLLLVMRYNEVVTQIRLREEEVYREYMSKN